jgi:hypothetical protein
VELRGPGGLQVREVRSGGGDLSQSDLRVLFALADMNDPTRVSVRIRWPDGSWQAYRPNALDRYLTVEEPAR